MSKATAKAEKTPRQTNIGQAREDFQQAAKGFIKNPVPPKDFRKALIAKWEKQFGCTTASAASMYNTCRKEAVEAGVLPEDAVGRAASRAAQAAEADMSLPWAVVENGTLVDTYESRSKAYAAKGDGQSVKKTADL